MDPKLRKRRSEQVTRWAGWTVALLTGYVLSSGLVIASAFWLREHTHRDEFYAAMWLYAPLYYVGLLHPNSLLGDYIGWWVELFGTIGPG